MRRLVLVSLLVLFVIGLAGCGEQGSKPSRGGGGGSGGTESEQSITPTPTQSVTPTPPAMGGARIKMSMYAVLPIAGGSDIQSEDGVAYLVFERQDGPPLIYTVHGAGTATWKEESQSNVCSWTAEADIEVKVDGVLDPATCELKLNVTEIFDDPVMTSQSGPCEEVEFTVQTWTYRVDLPLANNETRPAGPSIYDPQVTIDDIVLDPSIPCIVP